MEHDARSVSASLRAPAPNVSNRCCGCSAAAVVKPGSVASSLASSLMGIDSWCRPHVPGCTGLDEVSSCRARPRVGHFWGIARSGRLRCRARSRGAPCEGEGRRREGGVERSERYLDGRATMGKRAEVERPLQVASRLSRVSEFHPCGRGLARRTVAGDPISARGADASQPAAGAESWGTRRTKPSREPKRARQVAASGGGRRAKERPQVSRARAAQLLAGARGHAETAQRGVSSWVSEIGATGVTATAPIPSGAQVCAGCRFASSSRACRTYESSNVTL